MIRRRAIAALAMAAGGVVLAQPPGRRAESPAATPIPETLVEQSYPAALVEAGRALFGAQCGFCHGLDTRGGSGGPDLTRSAIVAADLRGDRIAPVVRAGRPDADIPMPAFAGLSEGDIEGIVAFIHDQKAEAESAEGGRRSVSVDDLLSGNASAGRRFFEANCTQCHSAEGDLAGIASRMEGLRLLQRMLNPRAGGPPSTRSTPRVTVTTATGDVIAGLLDYEDEFSIALFEADGRFRSFEAGSVSYEVEDPLAAHWDLLDRHTDESMHDVITYLHTLR
jgi:cytochrome c oxidase cbb3-type subunit III